MVVVGWHVTIPAHLRNYSLKANILMVATISVLPVFSKLLERLVYNRLISYIDDNKLLHEYQFGFQKGKSTHLAMMILVYKITEALEQGETVVGVFFLFLRPLILLIIIFH